VVDFVNDSNMRNKAKCPSLGELLPLLPLCDSLEWSDVVIPIVTEAFTRNARWAIKSCPPLADVSSDTSSFIVGSSSDDGLTDKERYRLTNTLEANAVSLRLIAFHCVAADILISDVGSKNVTDQISSLNLSLGKPSSRAIDQLKFRTRNLKTLTSWDYFFDGVKLPRPSSTYLVQWLRRSIELSSTKRYHNQYRALALLKQQKLDKKTMKQFEETKKNDKMSKYDGLLNDFGV
jgi:hypothetical protein